jgi:hypothetical protein
MVRSRSARGMRVGFTVVPAQPWHVAAVIWSSLSRILILHALSEAIELFAGAAAGSGPLPSSRRPLPPPLAPAMRSGLDCAACIMIRTRAACHDVCATRRQSRSGGVRTGYASPRLDGPPARLRSRARGDGGNLTGRRVEPMAHAQAQAPSRRRHAPSVEAMAQAARVQPPLASSGSPYGRCHHGCLMCRLAYLQSVT